MLTLIQVRMKCQEKKFIGFHSVWWTLTLVALTNPEKKPKISRKPKSSLRNKKDLLWNKEVVVVWIPCWALGNSKLLRSRWQRRWNWRRIIDRRLKFKPGKFQRTKSTKTLESKAFKTLSSREWENVRIAFWKVHFLVKKPLNLWRSTKEDSS